MSDPASPTFRDFASQVFAGDDAAAETTLEALLALPHERARAATAHFRARTADPAFLPRAMSLRTAVAGSDDGVIISLLGECFALEETEAAAATAALRKRYPA